MRFAHGAGLRPKLKLRTMEAIDIMVELYNQREAVESFGRSQYAEGQAEGKAEGKAEGEATATLSSIKNLMKNLKMTLDQAMQTLEIPTDDQPKYRAML